MADNTDWNENWLKCQAMTWRGAGGETIGRTHHLTEVKQEKYHYRVGLCSELVLEI